MIKYDEFKLTREYQLWNLMFQYISEYNMSASQLVSKEDMNDYWEPFLEMIYKLGNIFNQTGKFKELKTKWMRPIFYIETNTELCIDGEEYECPRESITSGQEVRRKLQDLCKIIEKFPELNQSNIKANKTTFKSKSGELWKAIIKFVNKLGFKELHHFVKVYLKPLLDLREASLHLFKYECKELGISEFVMFNDSNNCKGFIKEVRNHLDRDAIKTSKQSNLESINKYFEEVNNNDNFKYVFPREELREALVKKEELLSKKEIVTFKDFRKETYQKDFETALLNLYKYLNNKLPDKFLIVPNIRKLFLNLEVEDKDKVPYSYYNNDMVNKIWDLKILLYELKCNGISRINIRIKENHQIIELLKEISDLHEVIDSLYGDNLSYDQFYFFYECIYVVYNSNMQNELKIKIKEFMEEAMPRFIVLSAMRKAVQIEERMRLFEKDNLRVFKKNDFFQIINYDIFSENQEYINCSLTSNYPLNNISLIEELDTIRLKLKNEIKLYKGRFWILEGMFNKEDKDLWLKAIEILRNVNYLVQDDIRDYILYNPKEKDLTYINKNITPNTKDVKLTNVSSKKHLQISTNSIKKLKSSKETKEIKKKKLKYNRQNSNHDKSFESDDELIINKRNKLHFDILRPPYIWNFPVDKFKEKFIKEAKEKELINKGVEPPEEFNEIIPNTIRNIDPREYYRDGRILEFMGILDKLTKNMLNYCDNVKKNNQNIFKFYFEKSLNVFNIQYYST